MTEALAPASGDDGGERSERAEHHWATVAVIILVVLVVMGRCSRGCTRPKRMPQSRVETADPRTLHLHGEFIESNLGSALEPDGSVTVRAIGQQYSFTPQCILVPTDTPITFRLTSADVVHGFLITGTAINLMLVPGYISSIPARFSTQGERHMPMSRVLRPGSRRACGAGSRSSTRPRSPGWLPMRGG